jgi:DNA-directed RNA polymerase II subunit RPB2
VAEIRSQPDLWSNPNNFKVELRYIQNTPVIRCSVKQFNSTQGIPLFTLFRALGIASDQEILERIVYNLDDEYMGPMLEMLYGSL